MSIEKRVKVIATYLPQFHETKENSEWWGEGYTDWVGVKKAQPLYDGHIQPRVPLNSNYYNLNDEKVIRWQSELAKKYGVYGFGIYHYWFNDNQHFLWKPVELLLNNKDIDINFFLIWDNTSWVRTWSAVKGSAWNPDIDGKNTAEHNSNDGVLANLEYGTESNWKKHFEYLLPLFKDSRYIRINDKPVMGFMRPTNGYETLCKMKKYWDDLAKENGFDGVVFFSNANTKRKHFDYDFFYEPSHSTSFVRKSKIILKEILGKKENSLFIESYDKRWSRILANARRCQYAHTFFGALVDFDDTPRRGNHARIMSDATPHKFEKYMRELLKISQKKKSEFVFLTAWNEWGEGAYLEPDETNGYAYLEALKRAIDTINGD